MIFTFDFFQIFVKLISLLRDILMID
jgi:hypothetical protein